MDGFLFVCVFQWVLLLGAYKTESPTGEPHCICVFFFFFFGLFVFN